MNIKCSNLKCKYRNDRGNCKAKNLTLVLNSVCTLFQGQQDYLKCKSFEIDEDYIKLKNKIDKLLGVDKE